MVWRNPAEKQVLQQSQPCTLLSDWQMEHVALGTCSSRSLLVMAIESISDMISSVVHIVGCVQSVNQSI
eukprot:m.16903 g.16903  ORF g.16903 m.16903 type:complete len:69 (+) comp8076_c0_seq1:334-540(+)